MVLIGWDSARCRRDCPLICIIFLVAAMLLLTEGETYALLNSFSIQFNMDWLLRIWKCVQRDDNRETLMIISNRILSGRGTNLTYFGCFEGPPLCRGVSCLANCRYWSKNERWSWSSGGAAVRREAMVIKWGSRSGACRDLKMEEDTAYRHLQHLENNGVCREVRTW